MACVERLGFMTKAQQREQVDGGLAGCTAREEVGGVASCEHKASVPTLQPRTVTAVLRPGSFSHRHLRIPASRCVASRRLRHAGRGALALAECRGVV